MLGIQRFFLRPKCRFSRLITVAVLASSPFLLQVQAADRLTVFSAAFKDGEPLPKRYTADGENLSPPLQWTTHLPATKSYALLCIDPDAPGGNFVHWVLFDIPSAQTTLSEGLYSQGVLPSPLKTVLKSGVNSFNKLGWSGPSPPPGKLHHYLFELYALDMTIGDEPKLRGAELIQKMRNHIIASARLTATYQR